MSETKSGPGAKEQLQAFASAYWTLKGKHIEMEKRLAKTETILEELAQMVKADTVPYMPTNRLRVFRQLAQDAINLLKEHRKIDHNGK